MQCYGNDYHATIHRPLIKVAAHCLMDALNVLLSGIPIEEAPWVVKGGIDDEIVIFTGLGKNVSETEVAPASSKSGGGGGAAGAGADQAAEQAKERQSLRAQGGVKPVLDAAGPQTGSKGERLYSYFCNALETEKGRTKPSESLTVLPNKDTEVAKRAMRVFIRDNAEHVEKLEFPPTRERSAAAPGPKPTLEPKAKGKESVAADDGGQSNATPATEPVATEPVVAPVAGTEDKGVAEGDFRETTTPDDVLLQHEVPTA
jgi:hypothetical protein